MQEDNDLQFSEALIVEREQGIREIERSVNDVNEIFRDLAVLVKVTPRLTPLFERLRASPLSSRDRGH